MLLLVIRKQTPNNRNLPIIVAPSSFREVILDAFSPLRFTEADRTLQIDTPLGKDAFLTEKFTCRQFVNGLDEAKATLRANRDDVRAEDIVGKEVTVSLMLDHSGARRKWNYLVTNLSVLPRISRGFRKYELTLRPTMWLMSQHSDCRIFLNKTVIQMAEIFCDEHGIRGLDTSRVFDLPPAQDYIVQWNESNLDFLLRMFQKYGIFFWIRQDDGQQVLVMTNKPVGYDKGADGDTGRARIAAARPTATASPNGAPIMSSFLASAADVTGISRRRTMCRAPASLRLSSSRATMPMNSMNFPIRR